MIDRSAGNNIQIIWCLKQVLFFASIFVRLDLWENAVHNTYISSYEGFKAKLEGQGFKECQKRVSIAIVGKPMVV